jgi:hypothetical protein
MTDLIALIGTFISTASSLMDIAKKQKNAEMDVLISEFNIKVAQVNNEVASLLNENRKLKDELDALKKDEENPLTYNSEDGYYYDEDTKNPYCPFCYESEKIRIHIIKDHCQCPKCKEYFKSRSPVVAVAKGPGWNPYDHL